MSQLLAALGDNPYFGAGFGLMGLGLGASLARKGAQVGLILFRRHYMTTVEITCKDKVSVFNMLAANFFLEGGGAGQATWSVGWAKFWNGEIWIVLPYLG
jgi:hypothetical protein